MKNAKGSSSLILLAQVCQDLSIRSHFQLPNTFGAGSGAANFFGGACQRQHEGTLMPMIHEHRMTLHWTLASRDNLSKNRNLKVVVLGIALWWRNAIGPRALPGVSCAFTMRWFVNRCRALKGSHDQYFDFDQKKVQKPHRQRETNLQHL